MKKKLGACLVLTCIILCVVNVCAQGQIKLKSDKNSVDFGDEIVVSIDLGRENQKLYDYTARLSYDEKVFEKISADNFQNLGSWSDITYNIKNNRFALIRKSGKEILNTDGANQLQMKLKVKEKAKAGITTISLNSITASDGKSDTHLKTQSVEVEIIKEGLGKNESIPSRKAVSVPEENISIKTKKDLPVLAVILIALMIVLTIIVICFDIQKKHTRRHKMMVTVAAIAGVIVLSVITMKSLAPKEADIDKNGIVDYEDTQQIIDYLLNIKNPKDDDSIEDNDLNRDGMITAADIAQSLDNARDQEYQGRILNKNN